MGLVPPSKHNEGKHIDEGHQTEGAVDRLSAEDHFIEEEDGPWYFGKAKEEFHRRKNTKAGNARREEEDPIQVCDFIGTFKLILLNVFV